MRRWVVLLVVVAAVALSGGGATLALTKTCGGGDCVGTDDADTITGSPNADTIAALGGDDRITEPVGGVANDAIWGGLGKDRISDIEGGAYDHDRIRGEASNDVIDVDEPGFAGDDPNGKDYVHCGPGKKDQVFADAIDDLVGCEIKKINQRP